MIIYLMSVLTGIDLLTHSSNITYFISHIIPEVQIKRHCILFLFISQPIIFHSLLIYYIKKEYDYKINFMFYPIKKKSKKENNPTVKYLFKKAHP